MPSVFDDKSLPVMARPGAYLVNAGKMADPMTGKFREAAAPVIETTAKMPTTAPQTGFTGNPEDAFAQNNQLPWLGDLMLDAADYQTAIPQELQQQAQQGYGYQWMSDMFGNYLAQQGRQYGKALDMTNLSGIRSGFDASGVAQQSAADIQQQYGMNAASAYGDIYAQNESQKLAAGSQVQNMELANLQAGQNVSLLNDQYRRAIESATMQGTAGMADWLSNWNQDLSSIQNQQAQFEWGNKQQQALFEQQMQYNAGTYAKQLDLQTPKSDWTDYLGLGLQVGAMFI